MKKNEREKIRLPRPVIANMPLVQPREKDDINYKLSKLYHQMVYIWVYK